MNSLLRDLVFAARMLMKSPGFTIVAALSLAVGIGVNSTVFGFVNAALFKPLAVSNPEGLVYVFAGDRNRPLGSTSWLNYQEFQKQNDVFTGLAAYAAPPMLLTTGEQTEEVSAEVVSANYFSVFDVRPYLGQSFTASDEDLAGNQRSVVISDRLWKRRLNADPAIVGKQLVLNGNSFTVVGVALASFTGTDHTLSTEVWVPITQWATIVEKKPEKPILATPTQTSSTETARLNRDHGWLQVVGRLKPGVNIEQAQAVMTTIAQRVIVTKDGGVTATLSPVSELHPLIAQEMPTALGIMAITSLVLMICCVNVASLMLARAAVRRKEFAIRMALGSTRSRLLRQLMTEALLLSFMGGVVGLLFAYWTTRTLLAFIPPGDLSFSAGIAIDRSVLLFSFLISVVTAVLFGLLPALNSLRTNVVQGLGADSMALGAGKRKINLRRALVVVQIVASFVMLIAAGLFMRSFQSGQSLNASLKSNKILILNLSPKKYGYNANYKKGFYQDVLNRIGVLPGVESATLSTVVPLSIQQDNVSTRIDGKDARVQRSIVGSGYFETLGIPIVLGRGFEITDDDSSRRVAIVNEAMARTYWPEQNPLGKSLNLGPGAPYEVVGVAKNTPYNNAGGSADPLMYVSLYQRGSDSVSLIVRTTSDPKTMIAAVEREIKEVGGNLPIFDFKTLEEIARTQLTAVKAAAGLLGLLSIIGVLVAAIGIYGVTSYAFNQRRREIGIRMSFGAQPRDILKLIMREGTSLAVLGIAIGALLALATTHLISSFLFGASPVDPIVFVLVATTLGLVSIGASLVPAMMAAKSDPVEALRHE